MYSCTPYPVLVLRTGQNDRPNGTPSTVRFSSLLLFKEGGRSPVHPPAPFPVPEQLKTIFRETREPYDRVQISSVLVIHLYPRHENKSDDNRFKRPPFSVTYPSK